MPKSYIVDNQFIEMFLGKRLFAFDTPLVRYGTGGNEIGVHGTKCLECPAVKDFVILLTCLG